MGAVSQERKAQPPFSLNAHKAIVNSTLQFCVVSAHTGVGNSEYWNVNINLLKVRFSVVVEEEEGEGEALERHFPIK